MARVKGVGFLGDKRAVWTCAGRLWSCFSPIHKFDNLSNWMAAHANINLHWKKPGWQSTSCSTVNCSWSDKVFIARPSHHIPLLPLLLLSPYLLSGLSCSPFPSNNQQCKYLSPHPDFVEWNSILLSWQRLIKMNGCVDALWMKQRILIVSLVLLLFRQSNIELWVSKAAGHGDTYSPANQQGFLSFCFWLIYAESQ